MNISSWWSGRTPSFRGCSAPSWVDNHRKTKSVHPSPNNHNLQRGVGKAEESQEYEVQRKILMSHLIESYPYRLGITAKLYFGTIVNWEADDSWKISLRIILEGWKQQVLSVVELKSRSDSMVDRVVVGILVDFAGNANGTLLNVDRSILSINIFQPILTFFKICINLIELVAIREA